MTNPVLGTNAATTVSPASVSPSSALPAPVSPAHTASGAPLGDQLPTPRGSVDSVPAPRSSLDKVPAQRESASTVLLVAPDPKTHDAMCRQLAPQGMSDITTCATAAEAIRWLDTAPPGELALINLRLGADVHEVITALRSAGWRRILTLASAHDGQQAAEAMRAGATGIVTTAQIHPSGSDVPSSIHELTDREIDVIRMVADGRSNKWIGERLSLSALTIKSHLARIGRKLGTGDRAHIVLLALEAGVLT